MKGKKRPRRGANQSLGGSTLPGWKEPTPDERMTSAAKHLLREAVECDPGLNKMAASLGHAARKGAGKLLRGKGAAAKHSWE